jgi:hypothetical protein
MDDQRIRVVSARDVALTEISVQVGALARSAADAVLVLREVRYEIARLVEHLKVIGATLEKRGPR